ncbi:MAG TPA: hypothetical protein VFG04_26155 [Planctomycetaceae bacterium]|jgi:hypothetical protein|nr:hypothetical protein [Planctomycetaceae bacterium]
MSQAEVTRDPAADPRERFVRRPPSQAWEAVAATDRPANSAWVWFKPPAVPTGLLLRIAPEAFQSASPASQWTMRQLLLAADVEPTCVVLWRVNGVAFPAAGGTNPLLDMPVPAPLPGADPNIMVAVALPALYGAFPPGVPVLGANPPGASLPGGILAGGNLSGAIPAAGPNGHPVGAPMLPMPMGNFVPPHPMPVMPAPVMPAGPGVPSLGPGMPQGISPIAAGPHAGLPVRGNHKHEPVIPAPAHLLEAYEHVEQDWRACNEAERDLSRLRQQLLDMMGRLKTLNRDLTGPERVHSNNQEKKDWQQARRMLRDCTNRLWKCVKAHDIGYTSSAGQRRWFEETYEKYIGPRRHFEGFLEADRAFGTYRKIVTNLHVEMTNALSIAQLDGERRAQQVLARIAEKIREAGNRKNFLGVMLD